MITLSLSLRMIASARPPEFSIDLEIHWHRFFNCSLSTHRAKSFRTTNHQESAPSCRVLLTNISIWASENEVIWSELSPILENTCKNDRVVRLKFSNASKHESLRIVSTSMLFSGEHLPADQSHLPVSRPESQARALDHARRV